MSNFISEAERRTPSLHHFINAMKFRRLNANNEISLTLGATYFALKVDKTTKGAAKVHTDIIDE